ncbi:uncharacterized protein LOC144553849 [Carex rostrata]
MSSLRYYYLCNAGYPNGEGFLTPYRGQRYHLSDWNDGRLPRTAWEFYNYKHSSARNAIEQYFGLLKGRWAILRGKSFYPVKIQCRIIAACALIHNHIRREMPIDPLDVGMQEANLLLDELDGERITHIESTDEWTNWRDTLAHEMFTTWRSSRNNH